MASRERESRCDRRGERSRKLEVVIVTTLRVPKTGGIPTTKVIVVKWLKRKGQKVRLGEPLVELQTDKVNYELESPAEGVLLDIVAKEDSEVPVGEMLCHIGQPGDAAPIF
jgi:pyruvate/2-oxoglutarate dehydrogenase complex dihydrolipoamide acyltransferase (E2) component